MISQKSVEQAKDGVIYLIATPIGNLEDITLRALRLLKEVDVIAAEDTRNTKKLCNHFDIQTPLYSYHEHNVEHAGDELLARVGKGQSVALVSDAGMPCISDPGEDLVKRAIAEGYPVVPIPGANAALSALIASGIAPQPFLFYGFLSRNKKKRRSELDGLFNRTETLIFYEAPHRLKEALNALAENGFENRSITLAREITKKFEEFLRGTVSEATEWVKDNEVRGEFVIILEGNKSPEASNTAEWWEELSIVDHVKTIEAQGKTSKEAIKEVAKARDVPKRDVYQQYHT